jgi:hypothetical protein
MGRRNKPQRSHQDAIRQKSWALQCDSWLQQSASTKLNRSDAITYVIERIGPGGRNAQDPQILSLIELFNIMPEELSEAGLSYEAIKAIEQYCLSWRLIC